MSDATENGGPLPTDLGEAKRKKPLDMSTGLPRIDVTDRDQVFELALELMAAGRVRLMQANLAEWRAIARLAVMAAPILSRAVVIAEIVKPGDDWSVANGELFELVKLTRALLDAERASQPERKST